MWTKLFIVLLRIIGGALVFIATPLHLFIKFNKTTTLQVTDNSMPLAILILISIFVFGFVLWLVGQLKVMYGEYIRKHPFSSISIMLSGFILLSVSLVLNGWLVKISDLITHNAESFARDIQTYTESVQLVAIYAGAGLLLTLASFIWEKST